MAQEIFLREYANRPMPRISVSSRAQVVAYIREKLTPYGNVVVDADVVIVPYSYKDIDGTGAYQILVNKYGVFGFLDVFPKPDIGQTEESCSFLDSSWLVFSITASLSLSCYKAVVFLDIDGVLNSYRSVEAFGDYPHELNKELSLFDTVAVGLVRRLCIHASAGVVMSSTWRHQYGTGDFCEYLHLPVIGKTPRSIIGRGRGGEIEYWMKMNSCTYPYVIIDDEVSDMLPEQKDNIVHVCGEEGFSFKDYVQALQILKCVPKDGVARQSKYFPEVCGG